MDHCCVTVLVLYLAMRRSECLNLMVLNSIASRYDCDNYVSSDQKHNVDPVPFINLSLNCLITATSPGILKRPSSLSTDSLLRYATHWTTIGWMIPWGSGSAVMHEYIHKYPLGTITVHCASHTHQGTSHFAEKHLNHSQIRDVLFVLMFAYAFDWETASYGNSFSLS